MNCDARFRRGAAAAFGAMLQLAACTSGPPAPEWQANARSALDRTNTLLARIDGLAAKADQQVFGAEGLMPEARAAVVQLNAALMEARESLKKIDAILVDAQAIAGNARAASTDLNQLRAEIDANLRKVSRMIDEVNRRWPFAKPAEIKLP
jgi:phospholipid/cholesterol/gamma-HCH transport system substrate-binding protein